MGVLPTPYRKDEKVRAFSRTLLPALGASALLVAGAGAALATTISSGGAPYNGDVTVTNIDATKLSGNSAFGTITSTCTNVALGATVASDGSGGTLNSVSLASCTNNYGGTDTYSVSGLPASGATATYDSSHTNDRDGYLSVAANPNVDVRASLNLVNLGMSGVCHYALSAGVTIDLFNNDNANRPAPANGHSQGALTGQQLQLASNPENAWWCPSVASGNGTYQVVADPSGADLVIDA
jgi:hypothetical protein